MTQSPYEFIPATAASRAGLSPTRTAPSVVSDDDVAAKGLLPHDFATRYDVHLGFRRRHGEDHHRVVTVVHGVDFVALDVRDGGGALLDHGDVDGIGYRADVGDFLTRKDGFQGQTSLRRAVFSWLGF